MANDRRLLRADHKQAKVAQAAECVAHRLSRYAETLGDFDLGHLGTWQQVQRDDFLEQTFEDHIGACTAFVDFVYEDHVGFPLFWIMVY